MIDTEELEEAWTEILKYENYSSNSEFYSFIKAVKWGSKVIGDPTPEELESLTEEEISKVLAIADVNSQLANGKDKDPTGLIAQFY